MIEVTDPDLLPSPVRMLSTYDPGEILYFAAARLKEGGVVSPATATSDVDVIVSEPGNAVRNIGGNIDGYSTVLFLHHDLDQEAPALAAALGSSAFCIGPLGGTRPHRRRVERLRELRYDNDNLERVKAPIGIFGPTFGSMLRLPDLRPTDD